MTKLAVAVSGSGTLLEAMIAAHVPIDLVIADRPCRGFELAGQNGIARRLQLRRPGGAPFDRIAFTRDLEASLQYDDIDILAMAGFMTVLAPVIFKGRYRGRILNTHPSLLPSFKGDHAVRDALDFGVKVTGCTIHIATEKLDEGPILAQEAVRVLPGDTVESLHERIKDVERSLYPNILRSLLAQ